MDFQLPHNLAVNAFEPDDETLLGFLMKALEPDEMAQVDEAIRTRPDLQKRLNELAFLLTPLESDSETFEPAGDLVERTMEAIPELAISPLSDSPEKPSLQPANSLELVRMAGSWMDFLVLTASIIVIAGLLTPGLMGSRELARQEACSDNLRVFGEAFASFAEQNSQRELPAIELDGPLSFAGVYAIRLKDLDLLDESGALWCPSLWESGKWTRIPTSEQFRNASERTRSILRKVSGGSYAYNLGVIEGGKYATPKLQGTSTFAILGDAPMIDGNRNVVLVHSGRGINLLFEDGHVSFLQMKPDVVVPDDPYFNRAGLREAGLDHRDSALGPSHLTPVSRKR